MDGCERCFGPAGCRGHGRSRSGTAGFAATGDQRNPGQVGRGACNKIGTRACPDSGGDGNARREGDLEHARADRFPPEVDGHDSTDARQTDGGHQPPRRKQAGNPAT
ncbi:hypothetical protein D1872_230820 [compost metagenome]